MEEQKKIVKNKTANQLIVKLSKELKKIIKAPAKRGSLTRVPDVTKKELSNIIDRLDTASKNSTLTWTPAIEKFFTTIGIEYTFLKRPNDKRAENLIIKKMTAMSDKRQQWNKKIHVDGEQIIEFASPAHKNWDEMLQVYKKTVSTAKKCGLIFKRHDKGGGAGHIHMGIPMHWKMSLKLRFLKVLFLDISSRPYLNWIFNEPSDDRNANSMLIDFYCIKFLKETNNSSYIDFGRLMDNNNKSHAIRYDEEYDTIEMRFFNMMENEKMLEECVEFANAYFRHIYSIAKNDFYNNDYGVEYYNLSKTSLDKFRSKKTVVEDFNNLLNQLGLNPRRYKKYITKNYDARIALNKTGVLKMDYDIFSTFNFDAIDNPDKHMFESMTTTQSIRTESEANQTIQDGSALELTRNENGEFTFARMSDEAIARRNDMFNRLRAASIGLTTQILDVDCEDDNAKADELDDSMSIGEESVDNDFEVSENESAAEINTYIADRESNNTNIGGINFVEPSHNDNIANLLDLYDGATTSENSI